MEPERASDSPSAPSEYLAEFLSAIMRRQYAEALKYCRLILQYEPQNATARGFRPLLQQKLREREAAAASDGSRSWSSSGSERSGASSLELGEESDSPSASASPRSASSRSDADGNGNLPPSPPSPPSPPPALLAEDVENDNATGDDSHSKVAGAGAAALRRLRAHFACSIK